MMAAIGVFGLGLYWQSFLVQVIGGVGAFVTFLCMFRTLTLAQEARCPECSETTKQGWCSKAQRSDGIFVCPRCERRWRTPAIWGLE